MRLRKRIHIPSAGDTTQVDITHWRGTMGALWERAPPIAARYIKRGSMYYRACAKNR